MDSLKDRVRTFTEGILIMACPVLVAVALKKVDLKSEGNATVRGSISPVAAISLFLSLFTFVLLGIASILKGLLPHRFPYQLELVFRFSKLLVHACAVLQMLLAYMIFLLITMRFKPFLVVLVVFGLFLLYCCYLSVIKSQERIDGGHGPCDCYKKLEPSLDFSAALTSLLFLALEGLALEGQTAVGKDLDPRLLVPLGFTFFFCVVAVAIMLLAAVPPVDYNGNGCMQMCTLLHVLCGALTLFFAVVVLTITFELEKEKGITAVAVPCVGLFLFYLGCLCVREGNELDGNEVKLASLELTKVTFTGFLAISLPSIRNSSLSSYTSAFILITAMAVISGLLWRFMTHFKKKAAVWTAKVACLSTHGFVAAAAIAFMLIAMHALSDAEDECHIPCSSSSSAQLQLFVTCFIKKARERSSYALSSVNC
ncbi:uncharacterized protein LOC133901034 [Phragmites australis]|uniref:uncharacterized protein LOC133901034 n=1 Tax=Phragmites australis TaxID=29695 RepID=UPI002D788F58|nr:uncharacterized protein LOC133901034 [Phragmites australis]XP_062198322.1 uncharacterized protein LOC133901034 [Phragmites australis]